MNAARLLWAQWRRRPLQTLLGVLLLALGIGTLVFVLSVERQLARQMTRDAQGIDLVVGAKGSPLQLVLSAVYHVDIPTGNVPLGAVAQLRANRLVRQAIPLALGDNLAGFRIVGSEPVLLDLYGGRIARGAVWSAPQQAVLGSTVAAATGLDVGASFAGAHGLSAAGPAHEDFPYRVVGVLAPTGTVLDRLVMTGLDSVWRVHEGDPTDPLERKILEAEREVTAVLVQYASPLAAASLPRQINTMTQWQAAVPAAEVARLFAVAGVGIDTLRAFAGVLLLSALLALFVALTAALDDRRYDLAVMRLLGASGAKVALLLLVEAWLLAAAALALGTAAGLGALAVMARWSAQARSFMVEPWVLAPGAGVVLGLGLVVATVAVLIPAWRAARMNLHRVLAEGR